MQCPSPSAVRSLLALSLVASASAQTDPDPHAGHAHTAFPDLSFGAVIDTYLDGVSADDPAAEDGFDAALRLVELDLAATVDARTRAWVILKSHDGEAPVVEEAAIEFAGHGGRTALKAGRFYVDFGQQMQLHLEELRTLERPLVLREYLGEELAGTGAQFEARSDAGDAAGLRFSLGAFASLVGADEHDHADESAGPEPFAPARRDLDEFSLAARLRSTHAVGAHAALELGASWRWLPDFGFEDEVNAVAVTGRSNSIVGVDGRWTWNGHGDRRLTLGAELLLQTGDVSGTLVDPDATPANGDEFIAVRDDDLFGYYAFADYGFDEHWSAGVQWSRAERAEAVGADGAELDVYATWSPAVSQRFRLGATLAEDDLAGDSARIYLQLTAYIGAHSSGPGHAAGGGHSH